MNRKLLTLPLPTSYLAHSQRQHEQLQELHLKDQSSDLDLMGFTPYA